LSFPEKREERKEKRKGSLASQSVELYNNLWYNSIRGDDE